MASKGSGKSGLVLALSSTRPALCGNRRSPRNDRRELQLRYAGERIELERSLVKNDRFRKIPAVLLEPGIPGDGLGVVGVELDCLLKRLFCGRRGFRLQRDDIDDVLQQPSDA
jgi:hypothetical protein